MSAAFDKLRDQATALPDGERAALAHALIRSLEPDDSVLMESDWDETIVRRVNRVRAGSATLLDRQAFNDRLKQRIDRLA